MDIFDRESYNAYWEYEEFEQSYYQDIPTVFEFPGCRNCGDYYQHIADENDGDYVVSCEEGRWEEVFHINNGGKIYFLCKKCNSEEIIQKIEKEDLIKDIIE